MNRGLSVLVVEDDALIAYYIALSVEDAGHRVVGICDCAEATLAMLRDLKPDLAILDIRINGDMDGVQLALLMRAEGLGTRHIFVTGSGDPETKARAEATNPVAILQKPVTSRHLETVLTCVSPLPDCGQIERSTAAGDQRKSVDPS
jgi:two-component system, response regulator PdtaR